MKRSADRILTTHAGSLPQPDDLRAMVAAKSGGQPVDDEALATRLGGAVAEVVALQARSGMDVVNDGELSKPNFLYYARERLAGIEERPPARTAVTGISGRDRRDFPDYFAENVGRRQSGGQFSEGQLFCTGPLS